MLGRRVDGLGGRLGMPSLLVAGGFAVGALALAADALGADSQDVLFSGQASIPAVVDADSTKIVVVLLVAKFLAYGVSLGCGFRGGPIFPAVFLGVALASLPVVWFDTSPTVAIAIGAAAGMAAQTRLLITPLLFASLLVGRRGSTRSRRRCSRRRPPGSRSRRSTDACSRGPRPPRRRSPARAAWC